MAAPRPPARPGSAPGHRGGWAPPRWVCRAWAGSGCHGSEACLYKARDRGRLQWHARPRSRIRRLARLVRPERFGDHKLDTGLWPEIEGAIRDLAHLEGDRAGPCSRTRGSGSCGPSCRTHAPAPGGFLHPDHAYGGAGCGGVAGEVAKRKHLHHFPTSNSDWAAGLVEDDADGGSYRFRRRRRRDQCWDYTGEGGREAGSIYAGCEARARHPDGRRGSGARCSRTGRAIIRWTG
jgi:hypothetical protein